MSGTPTLPMIGPDGSVALIPQENIQAASDHGAKPAIKLYGQDGTPAYVPLSNMGAALKAGAITGAQYQQKMSPSAPNPNAANLIGTPMRFLKSAGGAFVDAGKGLYHTLTDAASPAEQAMSAGTLGGGQLGVAAYRTLIAPQLDQASQAIQGAQSPDMQTRVRSGAHALAAMIPLAGPAAASVGDAMRPQLEQGNVAGATGTLAGNAAIAALLHRAGTALTPEAALPGENYTPTQLKAHTGVLGRMTGLGDNFIPQDAATSTGSVIRQAAADNPAIAATAVRGGSTPENIAAFQAILQKANTSLEAPHAATLAQYSSVPADVSTVQSAVKSALPSTLADVAPEDAAALQEISTRLGTVNTLGGLNDLRQWLNNEAAAGYRQDSIAANRGTATKLGFRQAADAARNAYYDQLQNASGVDFQPIKAQQSALMNQQEGAAKLGQTLSSQQAIADEPKSPQQVMADTLTGSRAVKAGPLGGAAQLVAEKVLGRTPLTQPNYLIRKFLSRLPEPSPALPVQPAPAAAQILNTPKLSANASPQVLTPQPAPPTPPGPGQLPSGAVPLLSNGLDPRLLEQIASPGEAQPPQTPYPALNEATARTRVNPTQFQSPQPVAPSGPLPVTPSGQVLTPLQRFLQAGELSPNITSPSVDDLKRAIAGMRKRRGK